MTVITPSRGVITVTASFVPSKYSIYRQSITDKKILNCNSSSIKIRTGLSGSFNYLYGTYGLLLGGGENSVRYPKIFPTKSVENIRKSINKSINKRLVRRNAARYSEGESELPSLDKDNEYKSNADLNKNNIDIFKDKSKNYDIENQNNILNHNDDSYTKRTKRTEENSHKNQESKSTNSTMKSIFGKLIIIVTDTGAGISEENQKRLFEEIVQFNPEILQVSFIFIIFNVFFFAVVFVCFLIDFFMI